MSRTVGCSCATDPQMLMVDATGQDERKRMDYCICFQSQCHSCVHACDIQYIQHCVHVEITYVFDTCKIEFCYNNICL